MFKQKQTHALADVKQENIIIFCTNLEKACKLTADSIVSADIDLLSGVKVQRTLVSL